MQKLIFINGSGNGIDLTSGSFGITNWAGLSNVPLNIQTQQVPFEDGGVYLDALMNQRDISVTVAIYDGNNLELRYQKKRELISALNPKLGEGTLIYTNNYLSKQIKAVPQIPLFQNKNSNDAGTLKATVSFSCPSPYWEDLEETNINIPFGDTVTINNQGDIPTAITARFFTQNVVNPMIKNMTTDKKIEYHNTLTKTLNINTNIGNKTVYTENINLKTVGCFGNFTNVCFSKNNSLWVATTSNGAIFYSYNGIEWNIGEFEANVIANFNGVVYAENLNLFVAVGGYNPIFPATCKIATSTDGIHWINRGNSYGNLLSVTYSESLNLFVAVGERTIITSSDGVNWNASSSTTQDFIKVTYIDVLGYFYAITDTAVSLKSSDGVNWEDFSAGGFDIAYSQKQGIFILPYYTTIDDVIYPKIQISTDLENWTNVELTNLADVRIFGISYSEELNIFVATGGYNVILTSQNGTDWNVIQKGDNKDIVLNTSLYSKEQKKYLVMGSDSLIYSSNNGINWNMTHNQRGTLNGVTYSKKFDMYIGVGDNGLILASRDGTIWTNKNSNTVSDLYAITYSEELEIFIAVGEHNRILKSNNGDGWEEVYSTTSSSYELRDVIYSEKQHLFVTCGFTEFGGGEIFTSSDGVNWESKSVPYLNPCFCIIYSEEKNLFIVGSTLNSIVTSTDGITWTKRQISPSPYNINNITYSKENGYFFILAGNYIYKSNDSINWTRELISLSLGDVNKVVYSESNKMYYALCTSGKVYTSVYLINWDNIRDSGTELNSAIISEKNNNIIFVGNNGIIMVSYYSSEENQIKYISADSDMSFELENGENEIILSCTSGDFNCTLSYRQKYIGV